MLIQYFCFANFTEKTGEKEREAEKTAQVSKSHRGPPGPGRILPVPGAFTLALAYS